MYILYGLLFRSWQEIPRALVKIKWMSSAYHSITLIRTDPAVWSLRNLKHVLSVWDTISEKTDRYIQLYISFVACLYTVEKTYCTTPCVIVHTCKSIYVSRVSLHFIHFVISWSLAIVCSFLATKEGGGPLFKCSSSRLFSVKAIGVKHLAHRQTMVADLGWFIGRIWTDTLSIMSLTHWPLSYHGCCLQCLPLMTCWWAHNACSTSPTLQGVYISCTFLV